MKRIALAAAILLGSATLLAAEVQVPGPKCESKPEYPGALEMQSDLRRHAFARELKAYRECMMPYIDEQKAIAAAHIKAANDAIEEYNTVMKKIRDEQDAERAK